MRKKVKKTSPFKLKKADKPIPSFEAKRVKQAVIDETLEGVMARLGEARERAEKNPSSEEIQLAEQSTLIDMILVLNRMRAKI